MNNNQFEDFYSAYTWLNNLELWEPSTEGKGIKGYYNVAGFKNCISIDVVLVNPETKEIDDDSSLNTETNVWVEAFIPVYEDSDKFPDEITNSWWLRHDYELDTGGKTFEEAIINLARNVRDKYFPDLIG